MKGTKQASAMMKKNDIIDLKITDITDTGNGVGRADNIVVFVPQTAVGDVAKVKIIKVNKNYSVGKVIDITEPSKHRISIDCPCFSKCGGCSFRHIDYDCELSLKQKRVEDCIRRIAKVDASPCQIVFEDTVNRYRNKAQFPVGEGGTVGLYAPRSHRIIPVTDCLLQPQIYEKIVVAFKKWVGDNRVPDYDEVCKRGLLRHLYIRSNKDETEIMVVIVCNGSEIPGKTALISYLSEAVGDRLKSVYLNVNTKDNNVILGEKNILLYGEKYITDTICGISVRISPNSFYQVNRNMAELLYKKVREYAEPEGKTVVDLYCGTGTIGLTMAKECKSLYGVEIVKEAVDDALQNAKENGIDNAEFICGDALAAADRLSQKGIKPDIVILDPPRKGCDSRLIEIVANGFSPEKVVYVSCDPATLARDVAVFGEFGYKLIEYTPFDLFPRTNHVETVSVLSRQ